MKVCLNCFTIFDDAAEGCSVCGGKLGVMSRSMTKMRDKLKHPIWLAAVENFEQKERLDALLSDCYTTSYGVWDDHLWGSEEEAHPINIYVEQKRVELARAALEEFQSDLEASKECARARSLMIKPALVIILDREQGIDAAELVSCLEEHHISSYCETEKIYEASKYTAILGRISGHTVIKDRIFVEEVHFNEAKEAIDEFLKQLVSSV